MAWSRRGHDSIAVTHQLPGNRAEVRQASVAIALQGLIDRVE
jgi:nicotinamide mononucleotide (NMN) deamidase PncC